MIDMVPFGFALLGFWSKGNTGRGAAGDASPGSGFMPASGLISSGVVVARLSKSVTKLGSSKGALDAGPCHMEAFGRLPTASCRFLKIGNVVGLLGGPNDEGPCHIVAFGLVPTGFCRFANSDADGRLSGGVWEAGPCHIDAFGLARSCRFDLAGTAIEAAGVCEAGPCHMAAFGRPAPGSCASAMGLA